MRRLFLTVLLCFMTTRAWAAISSSPEGTAVQFQAPGTGTTVALQCGTNANRFVHVAVATNSGTIQMSGITYNTVPLTESTTKVVQNSKTSQQFYLNGAASGSNTLSMTMSASTSWTIVASCWSGVHPTSPVGTAVTATASAQTITSPSITVPAGGMVIDSLMKSDTPSNGCPVGSNQTEVVVAGEPDGAGNIRSQSSYKTISGSTTMAWGTCTNFFDLALIALPVFPAPKGSGVFMFR